MNGCEVAVFIDAENIPAQFCEQIFRNSARTGKIVERHAYGNFASEHLKGWLEAAPVHALSLHQTVTGSSGKNSADIALTIDCMELLHRSSTQTFVLVTSDSDFTQLAMRLRERGRGVIGLGKSQASDKFKSSFDTFVALTPVASSVAESTPPLLTEEAPVRHVEALVAIFRSALGHLKLKNDDWVDLSSLGVALRVVSQGFSPSTYGRVQLGKLLESCIAFETKIRADNRKVARLRPIRGVAAKVPASAA